MNTVKMVPALAVPEGFAGSGISTRIGWVVDFCGRKYEAERGNRSKYERKWKNWRERGRHSKQLAHNSIRKEQIGPGKTEWQEQTCKTEGRDQFRKLRLSFLQGVLRTQRGNNDPKRALVRKEQSRSYSSQSTLTNSHHSILNTTHPDARSATNATR